MFSSDIGSSDKPLLKGLFRSITSLSLPVWMVLRPSLQTFRVLEL
jgi:hypothetical protein